MISIIIPIYNVEPYLSACIESIKAQTYRDLEIILVDDGSPDKCPAICDELALTDSRIKVLHKLNGGLSDARNAGLQIATGQYITFVDSDDSIEPQMYERMIRAIERSGADICMVGSQIVDADKNVVATDQFIEGYVYNHYNLINDIVLPLKTASWNKLFRKEIVRECEFPIGRIHGEDIVFMLRVINEKTTLVTTDYVGYNYYKRGNSITTSAFNAKSFDEVWCKDEALMLMKSKFPQFESKATCWAFRSRMNILRVIYSTNHFDDYKIVIHEYNQKLIDFAPIVKQHLRLKELLEYYIYYNITPLYGLITKIIKF